jgi:hypothetical protein
VGTGGASAQRTFILSELADAVEDCVPWPSHVRGLDDRVALADLRRGLRGLPRPIGDPVGRSERRFQQTFAEIDRLVAITAGRILA